MNKEILESLTMLEDKLNLKNVKNDLFLTEAKNKPNDMDGDQLDYNEKKLYQKRADYDKKVKEFNDQSIEVERLKQVSQVNKDPAIEQNYERKKTALKTLKAEKSQAYWDKVNAGRDLKNIKYESYEFNDFLNLLEEDFEYFLEYEDCYEIINEKRNIIKEINNKNKMWKFIIYALKFLDEESLENIILANNKSADINSYSKKGKLKKVREIINSIPYDKKEKILNNYKIKEIWTNKKNPYDKPETFWDFVKQVLQVLLVGPLLYLFINNSAIPIKSLKIRSAYEVYNILKSDNLLEARLPSDPNRDPEFGVPEQKKYPLFDRKHVISAIKLFGHVEPKYESHLAHAIIKRMKKYNISFDIVGEDNKLYKYLPKTVINESVKFDISKFDTSEKILKAIDEYKLKKENLLNDGKDHPSCVYESLDNIIKQLEMKLDSMKINIDESFSNTLIEDIYDNQDGIFSLIESPSFEDADKWKVALYVVKFLTDSALDNILATHNVKQEDINKLKRKEKISMVTNIMNNFPGEIKNKIIYDENFEKYYIKYKKIIKKYFIVGMLGFPNSIFIPSSALMLFLGAISELGLVVGGMLFWPISIIGGITYVHGVKKITQNAIFPNSQKIVLPASEIYKELTNKNNIIKESLEYDNKMKIAQAVEFIKNTRQGRITADGSVTNEEDPEGVTQSAEEFANSKIGTEIEHALYFNSKLGDGWFIMLGVTGTEEPHIAYFYKEGDIFRVVDPVLGEMYDKRFSGNVSPLFKSFDSVVREYKKFTEDTYQVFSNIDFLVGQPISMFQELITKNWKNGELDTPEPVFEEETETVQEAMNPAQPTTSTKETVQNSNMQAREKAFDNQIETKENQIDNARENINSMKQTNANLRDNMQAATDEAGKNNLKAAIQAQTNRITRANVQVDRLEKQKRDLEKQKSNTLQQYEQRAKLAAEADNKQIQESAKIIHEALSICDLAFSGEVGKIAEYLITGQSTGNQEVDYIATKIKDSAIIKNIIFKYDRELQKINPDRTVISNLKLKLKSEINKIKKNY